MILNYIGNKSLFSFFFGWLCMTGLYAQADILTEADQMPYFMGCEKSAPASEEKRACSNEHLIRFISNHLVYPGEAKEVGVEGTVYVSFVVDEKGMVMSPKVIRDIGAGCGKAALDVLRNMPAWEPAIHQGEAVKVKLNVPIYFSLKNDVESEEALKYQINWGSLSTQTTVTKKQLEAQLEKILYIRDAYGDEKPITELIFAYEKKRTYLEGGSAGKINNELKKIVSKCKKGGTFTITAVLQIKGELIYVKRSFDVI